jgi:hypothetical protein
MVHGHLVDDRGDVYIQVFGAAVRGLVIQYVNVLGAKKLLIVGNPLGEEIPLVLDHYKNSTIPHLLFWLVTLFEPRPEAFEGLEVGLVLRDFGGPSLELEGGGRSLSVLVFERVSSRQGLGGFSVDEFGSVVLVAGACARN